MIIPITLPSPSSSSPALLPPPLASLGSSELFLIELQGDLETSGDARGQTIGMLKVDDDGKGKPTLRIGHHLLEGKFVNLPKPFAVLHKSPTPASPDPETEGEGEARGASYTIRAVVRKKLVFLKRPMPIVGATSSVNVSSLRAVGSGK